MRWYVCKIPAFAFDYSPLRRLYVCVCLSVCLHVSQCIGQRTISHVGSCFLRQNPLFAAGYMRLNGLLASGDSPVFTHHLRLGAQQ